MTESAAEIYGVHGRLHANGEPKRAVRIGEGPHPHP